MSHLFWVSSNNISKDYSPFIYRVKWSVLRRLESSAIPL